MKLSQIQNIYQKIEAWLPKENYKRIPLAIVLSIPLYAVIRKLYGSEGVLTPEKKRLIEILNNKKHYNPLTTKIQRFKKGLCVNSSSDFKPATRHLFFSDEARKKLYLEIWTPYLHLNEALVHIFEEHFKANPEQCLNQEGMVKALEKAMTTVINSPFNEKFKLLCKPDKTIDNDEIQRLAKIIASECYHKDLKQNDIREKLHTPFKDILEFDNTTTLPFPKSVSEGEEHQTPDAPSLRYNFIHTTRYSSLIIPLLHLNNRDKRKYKTQISGGDLTKILWFLRHYYSVQFNKETPFIKGKGEIKWVASHIDKSNWVPNSSKEIEVKHGKITHTLEHKQDLEKLEQLYNKKKELEKEVEAKRKTYQKNTEEHQKFSSDDSKRSKMVEDSYIAFTQSTVLLDKVEKDIDQLIEKISNGKFSSAKEKLKRDFFNTSTS